MHRRELVLGLVALGALAACSGNGGGRGSPATSTPIGGGSGGGPAEARSLKKRSSATTATDVATTAVNGLGTGLYRQLASERPSENLVLSPASIAIALAMTREGARGTTAKEMDEVLSVVDAAALGPSMNALDQALASRSGPRPAPSGEGSVDVVLAIANSLWGQRDTPWEQPFLDRLAELYGAGLRLTDFKTAAEDARHDINAWVSDRTGGRIADLLPAGTLDALTRLVLVNAVYLKAPWLTPFEETATTPEPFTRLDGTSPAVPMMHSRGQLAYATGDGWQAVDLPYAGYELTMTVLVPDAGRLAGVEEQVAPALLDAVVGRQAVRDVELGLPRWNTSTAFPLADALRAAGMPTAFDADDADFGGMTTAEQLYLSAVQHQADITVDEAGTEAAAATAAVIATTSAPVEPPVRLVVDRPFLFLIRDVPTGTLVFVGRVADPTASGS
jgi:serpin B